jgi:ABC-type multidrug transport system permease subunit
VIASAPPSGQNVFGTELRKLPAFFRRDFLVAWSYRLAFFSDWVTMFFQIGLFYFVGRLIEPSSLPTFGGERTTYLEFVAIGIVLGSFMQIGLNRVVMVMRTEQVQGTLESLLLTPTAVLTLLVGGVFYELVYVPVRTVIFLLLTAFLLGADYSLGGLAPILIVLLAFIPLVWGLGMISGGALLTFRRGIGFVGLGTLLLTASSSTYFPLEVLPSWLQVVGRWNPLTISLDAMRAALLGGAGWVDVAPAALKVAPMAAVSMALGLLTFRLALRRERRRGTLGLY